MCDVVKLGPRRFAVVRSLKIVLSRNGQPEIYPLWATARLVANWHDAND
jgi:hypothetical protein